MPNVYNEQVGRPLAQSRLQPAGERRKGLVWAVHDLVELQIQRSLIQALEPVRQGNLAQVQRRFGRHAGARQPELRHAAQPWDGDEIDVLLGLAPGPSVVAEPDLDRAGVKAENFKHAAETQE